MATKYPACRGFAALAVLCAGLLSGCITHRHGYTPPIAKWPIGRATDARKSVSVFCPVPGTYKDPTTGKWMGPALENGEYKFVALKSENEGLGKCEEGTLRAYRESGLFSEVKDGVAGGDLRALIQVSIYYDKRMGEDMGQFSLYLISMTVIPMTGSEEVLVETSIRDSSTNKELKLVEFEVRSWWHSYLYFPFLPFLTTQNKVLYDLHRATLSKAHARGMI